MRNSISAILLLALCLAAAGCTPWATYPPIKGAAGINNPKLEPIPELMADAIRHAHEQAGGGDAIVFNLPEGTPAEVYDRVASKLDNAQPMRESGEAAYHVTEVRVRATDAEVDLIFQAEQDVPQLMTVKLKQHFVGGWQVVDSRIWRIPQQLPPPYYTPPAEPDTESGG